MKKILAALFFVLAVSISGCEKYCTCTAPGETPNEIEINPNENCGDYSSGSYVCQ